MNLIKIGDRYINLNNVTRIDPISYRENTFEIEFAGRNSEDWGSTWVENSDATALRAWLARNSTDIATENNNHQVALDLAQELCDVLGAMEVADADEAHAHELLTGLIDTYWHPLRLALDATRATGS